MASKGRAILFVVLALIILFFGFIGTGFVVLYALFSEDHPDVDRHSVLLCDLRGAVGELAEQSIRDELFGRRPVNLTETVRLIRKAAGDDRIERIAVRAGGIDRIGWGAGAEIRDAFLYCREKGKPVDVYIEMASDLSYFIATGAGRIYLSPGGILAVDGLYAEVQLLKNLFGKVDVKWEAVTAGEYKSYPEAYVNDEMSDEFREQIDRLLDTRFDEYVEAIALGRTLDPDDVVAAVNGGPYMVPEAAVEAGLVDSLLFWIDYEKWRGIDDEGDVPSLDLAEYRDAGVLKGHGGGHEVAVVFVVGDIMPGESRDGITGTVAGSETVVEAIDNAATDDDMDAIVLRVSSPGGSVMAADHIWRAVERAKEWKPVIVSMGDLAASGGYWISAGADEIVADATTITGSIGVFALRPVWNGLTDRLGIGVEEFSRGENAALFYSGKPWTESHRRILEEGIGHSYDEFLDRVSTGRGMPVDKVRTIAGGRTWAGTDALENGLVDRIGGITEALEAAKEHAGIAPDEEVAIRFYPKEKSLLDKIRSGDLGLHALARRETTAMLEENGLRAPGILPGRADEGGYLWAILPFRIRE